LICLVLRRVGNGAGRAVANIRRKEERTHWRGMIARSSSVLAPLVLSGCTLFQPFEPPPAPTPELPPVVEPAPEIVPAPQPAPEPVAEPAPEPAPPPAHVAPLVAVVLSDRTPAYVLVANELQKSLDDVDVYDLSDHSLLPRDAFAAIAASDAKVVVAIGLSAARAARRFATVPVVISQVFNLNVDELLADDVRAVAVLPPIGMQMDAWHELDPSVRNVGAILGPGHDDLIAEAEQAMAERGIKFHVAIAGSDRETLYLFNRLVRDIDGFILFPDNRILSRTVLTEMMSYASRHRVQVAVFNEPLLSHGALLSTASVEPDIAAKIVSVIGRMLSGDIDSIPPITPLSEIDVQTNPAVVNKLGLSANGQATTGAVADAT